MDKKDYNTLPFSVHAFLSGLITVMLYNAYKSYLFKSVDGMEYSASETLFLVLYITLAIAGYLVTCSSRRTISGILVTSLIPMGIYTVLSFFGFYSVIYVILCVLAAVLCVLYVAAMMGRRIKNKSKKNEIIRSRIFKSIMGVRNISCFFSALIIVPFVISIMFSGGIDTGSVPPVKPAENEKWALEEHAGELELFVSGDWEAASVNDKLSAMQSAANVVSSDLGVTNEVKVVMYSLEERIAAAYDRKDRTIKVNVNYFNTDAEFALSVILHEMYHAYQDSLCELYDSTDEKYKGLIALKRAVTYKEEFEQYITADIDALGYYSQRCEVDARSFSDVNTSVYLAALRKYLDIDEPGSAGADIQNRD